MTELRDCVPSEMNPPANCILVTDEEGLKAVDAFLSRTSVFGLDIETNVVDDFYYRRIRTIQVGDKNVQYVIDLLPFAQRADVTLMDGMGNYSPHACFQPIIDTLKPYLDSKDRLKVGHNLAFEYETLKFCLNIRIWNLYDTFWAEKVIHSGEFGWHFKSSGLWALDDLVARYCRLRISKDEQKSFDLVSPLTFNQIVYAGLDTRWPLACKIGQQDPITRGNLWRAVQIENDAIPAFSDIHLNGLYVDSSKWMPLVDAVQVKKDAVVKKLDEHFIKVVGIKGIPNVDLEELESIWRNSPKGDSRTEARKAYMAARKAQSKATKEIDSYEGEAAINYSSGKQLYEVLLKMGFKKSDMVSDGKASTDDKVLKKLAGHPVIDLLREYRKLDKILTTYGSIWCKTEDELKGGLVHGKTGRIHPRLVQIGAETGRTSCREPNVQNIPRDASWRGCFTARPGYKLLTIDFNGCELRILTEYSREPAWLSAFLNDWDVHSVGAEIIFGKEWVEAAVREPYTNEKGKLVPCCSYFYKENNKVKGDKLVSTGKDHEKCSCPKHKDLRDRVKALNFGIAYGLEYKSLAEQLQISETEAKQLLARYKKAFPILIKYLESSGKVASTKLEARTLAQRRRMFRRPTWDLAVERTKEYFKRKGKTAAPTTRDVASTLKQMYGSIEREGKNMPIQGSNADIIKIAMGCGYDKNGQAFLWQRLETEFHGLLVNMVHDELVVEVPDEYANDAFEFVCGCMTRAGAELVKSIPMTTDGKISDKWEK